MATHIKIRVAVATRTALKAVGWKDESYDDVIRRLIERVYGPEIYAGAASILGLPDMEEEVKK